MTSAKERVRAAKLVARLTTTHKGRHYLSHNGYRSGQAIVVAGYDETIKDVIARVHEHNPPVTIALVKVDCDELFMFSVTPGDDRGKHIESASPISTIGMLYEAASQSASKNETFRITEWATATAHAMPSARELLAV